MLLGHAIPISGIVLVCRRRNLHRIIRPCTKAKPTEGVSPHTLAPERQTTQSSEQKCRPIHCKPADVVVCNRAVPATFLDTKEDRPGCSSHPEYDSTSRHDVAIDCGSSFRLVALKRYIYTSFQSDISRRLDEPEVLEAKATQVLSLIVLFYFVSIFSIGVLAIAVWLRYDLPDVARAYNVAPSWAGAFLAASAFSNNGMSLIDANMVPFQKE